LPFGEELSSGTGGRTPTQGYSGDTVRQKFTSKERDIETGLDYFLARYYSSTQGRFTSVDPIKLTPERIFQPQRLNLYSYTINNPLNLIDPDGKDIDFINNTREGRRKALLSITANMTAREAKNVGVRWNKDTHKYEGYVKNPSKIDLGNASQGYKDFSDRVNNHDLKLNYAFLGKGDSVTMEINGVQTKVTQNTLRAGGSDSAAFLAPQSDGSFTAVVAEGGLNQSVLGLTPSGREVPVIQPDFIMAVHELFAETYKYTPAGIKEGLNNEERVIDDSNKVIEIENKYRDFHGLPHRSGTDHGYIHAGTVTVKP